jgi:hypothetical protein
VELPTNVFTDLVAPVVACSLGARWAGQDRAAPKGSLDAPKRSRTIRNGATLAGSLSVHSLHSQTPCA